VTCCDSRRPRPVVFVAIVALSAAAFIEQAIGTQVAVDTDLGMPIAAVAAGAAVAPARR
jgi:hypothetical protein